MSCNILLNYVSLCKINIIIIYNMETIVDSTIDDQVLENDMTKKCLVSECKNLVIENLMINSAKNNDPYVVMSLRDLNETVLKQASQYSGSIKISYYKNEIIFFVDTFVNETFRPHIIKKITCHNNLRINYYLSSFSLKQLNETIDSSLNLNISVDHNNVMLCLKKNKSLEITFLSNDFQNNFTVRLRSNCEDDHGCDPMFV